MPVRKLAAEAVSFLDETPWQDFDNQGFHPDACVLAHSIVHDGRPLLRRLRRQNYNINDGDVEELGDNVILLEAMLSAVLHRVSQEPLLEYFPEERPEKLAPDAYTSRVFLDIARAIYSRAWAAQTVGFLERLGVLSRRRAAVSGYLGGHIELRILPL